MARKKAANEPLADIEERKVWRPADKGVNDEERAFTRLADGKVASLFVGVRGYEGPRNILLFQQGDRQALIYTLRVVLDTLERDGTDGD